MLVSCLIILFTIMNTKTNKIVATLEFISIVVMIFLLCIGITGNFLVICVFGCRKKSRRTRFEVLLLILAIIDLISITIVPLTFLYLTTTKFKSWDFGYTGCKFIPSLLQISITLSQGVILLICYERYCAIVHPFQHRFPSKRTIALWLIMCAIISILSTLPYQISFDIVKDPRRGIKKCIPKVFEYHDMLIASSTLWILRDFASALILVVLSYQMHHSLSRKVEVVKREQTMFSRSRKIITAVVVIFTTLCLPVDVYSLIYNVFVKTTTYFGPDTYRYLITANTFLNLIQASNAAVNVFIYSKMHILFRNAVCRCLSKGNDLDQIRRKTRSKTITSLTSVDLKRPPSKTILSVLSIDNERQEMIETV